MIDIIITTYNRANLLKRTMASFISNTDLGRVGKIIISNDGSTDDTQEYLMGLSEQIPKIQILPDHKTRHGIIPRFNMALKESTADIVCEFQDDVQFTSGWLEKLEGYLDRDADFITGFNAKEHKAFKDTGEYLIKHSTRFTQLLAKRSTWDRFFPMKSEHNFPTPTKIDGKCIGSGIDMKLFGGRKNKPSPVTKFLVVPNVVTHLAERYNSTWRDDISKNLDKKNHYYGGLNIDNVQSYWKKRYRSQKDIAVGFAGKSDKEQEKILKIKKDFIIPEIDIRKTVFDYGCGVGKFSGCFFRKRYFGVDITPEFIEIAKKNNPEHCFYILEDPLLDISSRLDFDIFFTANVLQHNCDYIVAEIFKNLKRIKQGGFEFILYENIHDYVNTSHMCFRKPEDYISFISEHFDIKDYKIKKHRVHNEDHALIKVVV